MTLIISGFPGIGKTYFKEHSESKVADSDSSKFSWLRERRNPDFPQNYIDHIKEIINDYDIILVSSHAKVRQALVDNELDFTLFFPDRTLKDEYIRRFKERGSTEVFVSMIDENWDHFITEMEQQKGCDSIQIASKTYLSNYLK